jgi:hypothetical protein
MKKTYLQPEIKIFNINTSTICAGSGDTLNGGGNLGNASTDGTTQLSRDNSSMWDDETDNE